ncbi:hypothetical protein SAMN05444671_0251 [Flavobacterium sp. CF108]|uniref:hypothetical protein n=1 Tax=unclassified Flavobacterium TaxID=196869 RepID=UPI0008D29A66|nr:MULTISPECIES: hypothetical protein [unclassified Flavobacterium]SEP22443.1 hypothetical protein SAMN04487978_0098 [Flavobacterium sp. fv08]SHI07942.1 hypothetical protein SAMN05444671_0251 [Flavobacterium sp. CF108]
MKITLQRKIAFLWFTLSFLNFKNYIYQTIRLQGAYVSFGDNIFTVPYFGQILSYELFGIFIPISGKNLYILYQLEWYSSMVLTLLSIIIPIVLFFEFRYSKTIAKVFLGFFILLNVFAILVKMTFLLPVANKSSEYEIMINKKVMSYVYYYLVILFIALLMFIGLFFLQNQKRRKY